MKFSRNLIAVCAAAILAGCSDETSEIAAPAAPQPVNATAAVSIDAQPGSVLLPSGATVTTTTPPPDAAGVPAGIPRDPSAPIVEGSAQDPNVLPPGFIPKAPALEYVKNGAPNLEALSEALQVYCMWKKTVPADLQELVTSKYLSSLPPAPNGKKYAIDTQNLTVVLVN